MTVEANKSSAPALPDRNDRRNKITSGSPPWRGWGWVILHRAKGMKHGAWSYSTKLIPVSDPIFLIYSAARS